MKKTLIVLILLLIVLVTITNAQTLIIGIWQLAEMTIGGETVKVGNMHVDFNQNGKLYISGREFGTWQFDKTNNTLNATANRQLEIINGANKIEKLNDDDLVLLNPDTGNQTFKRVSLPYGKEYKNEIVGEYIILKIMKGEKTTNYGNTIINFKNNSIVYFQDMFFGTWKYDEKQSTLSLSTREKEFNGLGKIIKQGNELVYTMESSAKLFLKKLDRDKINKENKESGLTGLWKIEINDNEFNYILLEETNEYSYGQGNGGSAGMWVFDKKEKTFSIIGRYIPFSGINTVIEISENKFIFKDKNEKKYAAVKTEQDAKNYDKLNFREDEYFNITDDSREVKVELDVSKLPWNDFYSNIEFIKNIKMLKYTYLKPIRQFNMFEKRELSTPVKYNQEKNIIEIDDIFYNGQIGNKTRKLKYGKLDFFKKPMYHPFFIFKEILTGKIIGQEKITSPAGTFQCTLIEGYRDWGKKIKLWMINDKPGVYAKIIKSDKNSFGDHKHQIFILKEIVK